LIHVSTSHVYEPSRQPITEQSRVSPVSFYGLSKLQGEEWVGRSCADSLTVRVFSYFDTRQLPPFLIPSLRKRIVDAEAGAELELHGAGHGRDFLDAEWVAEACVRLALTDAVGIVNCGSGRRTEVQEIAALLAKLLGRPDIGWRPVQDGPANDLVADTRLLKELVPDLARFDLYEALKRYVAGAS
jgi:nucleoside-diphosphate-sugar epimerase